MPLTLDEIHYHEERLRQEIAERERLLDAYQILRTEAERSAPPSALRIHAPPPVSARLLLDQPASAAPAAPASLPYRLPAAPPIHPELATLGFGYGKNGRLVSWAIQRMTEDFTLRDIEALLRREGSGLHAPEISVVLTRLKQRGQITEIRRGAGPIPALFRKPDNAAAQELNPVETPGISESAA